MGSTLISVFKQGRFRQII